MSTNDSDIKNYDTTPANNTREPPLGAPEGMKPNQVNDIIRQKMSDQKIQWLDAQWFNHGHDVSRASATTFKVTTDQTSEYLADRRLKFFDANTLYGRVISSSFTTETTVSVELDSGSLTASLTGVGLSILTKQNTAIPSNFITASEIDSGAITTDKISDNAVTLAKLATASAGSVIYFNSSGAATTLAPGTSGEYLQTQGAGSAPTWAAVNGDLAVLQTTKPSATSRVIFNEVTTTYTNYEIQFNNVIPAVNENKITLRVRYSGSTIGTTVYSHASFGLNSGGTSLTNVSNNDTAIELNPSGAQGIASSGQGSSGVIKILNPADTKNMLVTFQSAYDTASSTASMVMISGGGRFRSSTAVDGFEFRFDSGNITSGTVKLFGYS